MEKLIYVHVLRLGEHQEEDPTAVYRDATNDWYVIKPTTTADEGVEICRAFEDVATLNHPNPPLKHTLCQAIGSSIYVFAGTCILCDAGYNTCGCNGSSEILCLDTQNPKHGWRTCFTIPTPTAWLLSNSAVVDDRWLYVFAAHYRLDPKLPRCLAFDVVDRKTVKPIPHPGVLRFPPYFSTCISPGKLVAYKGGDEDKLYQLDCNKNSGSDWSVFQEGFPYPDHVPAAVEDGIFYSLNPDENKFISYDIGNKKELFVASLPPEFEFGPGQLIVLSKNSRRFCFLWRRWPRHRLMLLTYTRFSVRFLSPESEPYVLIEEKQTFSLDGASSLLNIVAV